MNNMLKDMIQSLENDFLFSNVTFQMEDNHAWYFDGIDTDNVHRHMADEDGVINVEIKVRKKTDEDLDEYGYHRFAYYGYYRIVGYEDWIEMDYVIDEDDNGVTM